MSRGTTPYHAQPRHAFWRDAIARVEPDAIDPVVNFALQVDSHTKIATAGSCFAQHIARNLVRHGFSYHVAEPAHPLLSKQQIEQYNYGTFSARYGNIYTSRQLLQLFLRAYGEFDPVDDCWFDSEHACWIDPFRPNIQPEGFSSREELLLDRQQHFAAVRSLFESLDVFVFTLGLTELWSHRQDGAAYPLCPGVAGGQYDPTLHAFENLSVAQVVADMREFLVRLRIVNPASRVILTVSPVPLIATGTQTHVLCATTYSKSVLRVAAETLVHDVAGVHYFPSYEIITSNASRGRYYAADCRDVTEEGVAHVMRLFFQHVAGGAVAGAGASAAGATTASPQAQHFLDKSQQVVDTICEESLIEQVVAARPPEPGKLGALT